MRRVLLSLVMLLAVSLGPHFSHAAEKTGDAPGQDRRLAEYLAARQSEFTSIPAERQRDLKKLAGYVQSCVAAGQPARLVFICTHNSRRSHMAQIWAAAAAAEYHVPQLEVFSGGTEATAFNPRAIAALERAGVAITKANADTNPKYAVRVTADGPALECFSKKFSDAANPQSDFCAVMTCSSADKNCPSVPGAAKRLAITYDDPKVADDTPAEAARYDERCAQICREMLFAFSAVTPVGPAR